MSQRISSELRALVRQRAHCRCEYCLIHEDDAALRHQPDHVVARKHGGQATADNLAYACALCNSFKGTDLTSIDPETGRIVRLFNPRQDDWAQHFRMEAGRIVPLSPEGRVTEYLLQFNRPEFVEYRRLLMAAGRLPAPH